MAAKVRRTADHGALERLDALAAALTHPYVHTHRVTRSKRRQIAAHKLPFQLRDDVQRRSSSKNKDASV